MANPAQQAKKLNNMPVCVNVMKFKSEVSDDTLRLIASGGIHRVGSPFVRFFGIVHAAVVSRFSHGFTAHRLATRKNIAAKGGNGAGDLCCGGDTPFLCKGTRRTGGRSGARRPRAGRPYAENGFARRRSPGGEILLSIDNKIGDILDFVVHGQ